MGDDFDETVDRMGAELQRERETRVRVLDARKPNGRGAAYSGGVELEFVLSRQGATIIDCNRIELRAWGRQMLALADQLDAEFLVGMLQEGEYGLSPERAREMALLAFPQVTL